MQAEELKGKRVTIMGLGLHGGGVGTTLFLHGVGAKIIVTDIKTKEDLQVSLEKLKELKNIEYVFGQHRPEDFTNADLVVKSPPVPWSNKYIKMALDKKIPVETDSSLFFKLCRNPIVGITGTKGKTTTATLVYEILKAAGKDVIQVGIGQVSVLNKLSHLKKESLVVFELSSWRLAALGRNKISPQISVITNIYPDHLNYYGTMDKYILDKKYIFLNQKNTDFCILNWDDPNLNILESEIKSQLIKFSEKSIKNGKSVYLADGIIYWNNGVDEKKIMEVSEITMRGSHNVVNILAAISATKALGIESKYIRDTIKNFKGIPHRLELVRELNGVKYINDTAATTPESAIAGIRAFSEPVILIAGGTDKKLDVPELAKIIAEKVKGVVFLKGNATDKIIVELKKIFPDKKDEDFKIVESMEKALEFAKSVAETGDVILLSPGAASFGLFANEFDRGNKFKEAVNNLK
jgi:UDP-N-acetylmuramoylalanine--D-glutamate ligase